MEPRIVERDEFKVVGLEYIGKNESNEIPALWGRFFPRMGEIKDQVCCTCYGVCSDLRENGVFSYVACTEVSSLDDVPHGMVGRVVPGGKFALFTHKGKLDSLGATYGSIYKQWLPASGLDPTGLLDFEVYDERFKYDSDDSEMDIYVQAK